MHQVLYAIGMELTCKLAPRSMHQVIGIGAALCAWLASHPEVLPRLKLFEVLANLQEALTFCIPRIPHIPKALAMWALSLIHVLLLSRFSAPTLESRKWRNRLFFLNVNPETHPQYHHPQHHRPQHHHHHHHHHHHYPTLSSHCPPTVWGLLPG